MNAGKNYGFNLGKKKEVLVVENVVVGNVSKDTIKGFAPKEEKKITFGKMVDGLLLKNKHWLEINILVKNVVFLIRKSWRLTTL